MEITNVFIWDFSQNEAPYRGYPYAFDQTPELKLNLTEFLFH